jgi:hypothetical protein
MQSNGSAADRRAALRCANVRASHMSAVGLSKAAQHLPLDHELACVFAQVPYASPMQCRAVL